MTKRSDEPVGAVRLVGRHICGVGWCELWAGGWWWVTQHTAILFVTREPIAICIINSVMDDAYLTSMMSVRRPEATNSSALATRRCKNCGAFGLDVIGLDGVCDHCRRSATGESRVSGGTDSGSRLHASHASVPVGSKRVRADGETVATARHAESEQTSDDIARLLDDADKIADVPSLDGNGVKRLLLALERAITRNALARAKYADEPARFIDSEVALDEELKRVRLLAAAPEQYGIVAQSDCLKSLIGLLSHDNTDIATDVIVLLGDMTDADALVGAPQSAAEGLVAALVEAGLLELLITNLQRLDDSEAEEDSQGVYASFALVENLLEIDRSIAKSLTDPNVTKTSLLAMLLRRLRGKTPFDANRPYASELLAILVQADSAVKMRLGSSAFQLASAAGVHSVDGIEMLLEIINQWKKRQPASTDEEECVENIFDALCSALLLRENQDRFRSAEGFELLLRIVHEAGFARHGALRVLSFAIAYSPKNAEALVDTGGLKAVFPAFMGKSAQHTRKLHGAEAIEAEEESVIATVYRLFTQLPSPALLAHDVTGMQETGAKSTATATTSRASNVRWLRLLSKLTEADHEKIGRLVQLFSKYRGRVAAADEASRAAIVARTDRVLDRDDVADVDDAVAEHAKRIDAGLIQLERLATCIAIAVTDGDASGDVVAFPLRAKLLEQGESLVAVIGVLEAQLARVDLELAAVSEDEVASARIRADAAKVVQLIARLRTAAGVV